MLAVIDKTTVVDFIEAHMRNINPQYIKQLTKKLSPLMPQSNQNIYYNFCQAIIQQYRQKVSAKMERDTITNEIFNMGIDVNAELGFKVRNLLDNEFMVNALKQNVEIHSFTASNSEKYAPYIPVPIKPSEEFNNLSIAKYKLTASQNIFGKVPPARNDGILNKFGDNKASQNCMNLMGRPQCLCDNIKEIKLKDDSSFKCLHCNRLYHTVCMKKKSNSQFCCYCHLQKMAPLKRPVKTIFVGLMKKNKKKHIANFFIPDIQPSHKVQVRCLRLKQGAQLSCLFPDVAELSINGQRVNMFEPINKQSCLKYRKDEPFNLLKGDFYKGQENTLVVSQNIQINKQKDIRNDPQNHVIGIYVIEDVKIENMINEIKLEHTLGFSQCDQILKQSFGLGKDDQITCQLVKIPLVCPLTTAKIQIPARGAYCTHFQCFDLRNYLTLISESQNPRWKCPLCPALTFQFRIDSVLQEIIKETKNNQKVKEVLFFKNGDYSMIIDEQPLPERKNIRALNIPQRKKQTKDEPQKLEKPKKRPNFFIPQNTLVIDLDD